MKKVIYSLLAIFSLITFATSARDITGSDAQKIIAGAEKIKMSATSSVPEFIKLREGSEIPFSQFEKWSKQNLKLAANSGFKLLNSSTDKIGVMHYRYQQTINNIPVEGTMYLLHVKNNLITSLNGTLFDKINAASIPVVTKAAALNNALQNVNATLYRWQVAGWEQQIKKTENNPFATWYPKGELVYAPSNGKYASANYHLCYKFDVYAQEPLSRQYIFVDAQSGQIIYKQNRIQDGNAIGTDRKSVV